MYQYQDKLFRELEEQLNFINYETDDILKRSEMAINVILKQIENLRTYIAKYRFRTEGEEIKFFKECKPQFVSRLIYHMTIYNIESKRPSGGDKVLKKYLQNELEDLRRFFDNNLEFFKYYRTKSIYLDHSYFVRGRHDIRLAPDAFSFEADRKFCTSHDHKVSKILASDLLQVYLEDRLLVLKGKEPKTIPQDDPKVKLSWTESKTALIELIYALHSQGSFDNGQADIKHIASYFESVFNVDLGDYYRTYLEIRIRKTGRTKFLSALQDTLIKRMEDMDEK